MLWTVVSVCCLVIVAGLVLSASTRTIRTAEPNEQNSPDANIESLRAEIPATTPEYEPQSVEEHQKSQQWIHPQTPPSSPPSSASSGEPPSSGEPAEPVQLTGRQRPRGQAASGGELMKDQQSPEIEDLAAIRELKRCKAALVAIMPPKTGSRHLHQILKKEYPQTVAMPDYIFFNRSKPAEQKELPACDASRRWIQLHTRPPKMPSVDHVCQVRTHMGSEHRRKALRKTKDWREVLAYLAKARIPMATVVRDPTEMVLSYYSFTKRVSEQLGEVPWSLRRFVHSAWSSNMQSGYLVGKRSVRLHTLSPGSLHNPIMCTFDAAAKVEQEDLDYLKGLVLERKLVVGVSEDLQTPVKYLSRRLAWVRFDPTSHTQWSARDNNQFSHKQWRGMDGDTNGDFTKGRVQARDVEPELLEMIRSRNQLDQKLYEFAQEQAKIQAAEVGYKRP